MKGFWAVPKLIAKKKDLSYKAKLVAGILWSMKNSKVDPFPSRKFIADALGISIKTVDRGIKELRKKAGLIVKRKGLRRNNRYLLPDWEDFPDLSSLEETNMSSLKKAKVSTPIVIDNSNKYTVVDESSSPIKDIFHYFKSKVKEIKGYKPEINWAKEGKIVKQRLKKYQPEQIKEMIDWYLHSKHSERLGGSLSICLSANIINLWKASKSSLSCLNKLYPSFHG